MLSHTRAQFHDWADKDGGERARKMEAGHLPVVGPYIDSLELPERGCFLDVGCGTGYVVELLAKRFPEASVQGLDTAPAMVETSRKRCAPLENTAFHESDFEAFARNINERFDFLFSMEAWYYFPVLERSAADLFQILKPGGKASILMNYFYEHESSRSWPEDYGIRAHMLKKAEWMELFSKAGLNVQSQVSGDGATLFLELAKD